MSAPDDLESAQAVLSIMLRFYSAGIKNTF